MTVFTQMVYTVSYYINAFSFVQSICVIAMTVPCSLCLGLWGGGLEFSKIKHECDQKLYQSEIELTIAHKDSEIAHKDNKMLQMKIQMLEAQLKALQ
jgi:hypothetical protein